MPPIKKRNKSGEASGTSSQEVEVAQTSPRKKRYKISKNVTPKQADDLEEEEEEDVAHVVDFLLPAHLSQCSNLVFERKIGRGFSGAVFTARLEDTADDKVAVKVYPLLTPDGGACSRRDFRHEVRAIRQLNHKAIISDVIAVGCPEELALVMQYYPRGDLLRALMSISQRQSRLYFFQLCGAVNHMYSKKVVHLDIKLENILLAEKDRIVLSDFGFSQILPHYGATLGYRAGTKAYVAPEFYSKFPVCPFKLDVYATGVVLWALTFSIPPRADIDMLQYLGQHDHVHSLFRWCMYTLMEPNAKKRTIMPDFVQHLKQTVDMKTVLDVSENPFPSKPPPLKFYWLNRSKSV